MLDIKAQVKSYIVENLLFGQGDALTDDASLVAQGVLDSTGVLELVMYLEKTFAIAIRDEELLPENLDSLNAIARFVQTKQHANVSGEAICQSR
jgi:acyl carrier protein